MQRVVSVLDSCENFLVNQRLVVALFRHLDDIGVYNIPPGDLSVAFVNEAVMASLHGRFLDDPVPTDVITFDGDSQMNFAGEIIVCPDYGYDRCNEFGTTLDSEIMLYLVHGYLHLAGLDDVNDRDLTEMREAEAKCMAHLNSGMNLAKSPCLIKYIGS